MNSYQQPLMLDSHAVVLPQTQLITASSPQYCVLLMASPESCAAGLAVSYLIPNGNEALC